MVGFLEGEGRRAGNVSRFHPSFFILHPYHPSRCGAVRCGYIPCFALKNPFG